MTDISNTMNASGSVTVGASQVIVAESPDTVLSPEIQKAMDIIFPKSAVQLLQEGCSLPDGACLNTEGCLRGISTETTTPSASVANDVILTSCASTGHNTTTLATGTGTLTETLTHYNRPSTCHITTTTTTTGMGTLTAALTTSNCTSAGHITTTTTGIGIPSETLTNSYCPFTGHITTLASTIVGSPTEALTDSNFVSSGHVTQLTTAVVGSPTEALTDSSFVSSGHVTQLTTAEVGSPAEALTCASCTSPGHTTDATGTVISSLTETLTSANHALSGHITTLPSTVINSQTETSGGASFASFGHFTNVKSTVSSPTETLASVNPAFAGPITTLSSMIMSSQSAALAGATCPSAGHITTLVSTNTMISPSADFSNDHSGNECPVGLLSPFPTDSLAGALANSKNQDVNIDLHTESKNKKSASKSRISKADLEIISSCDAFDDESLEKSSRRFHSADLSSSECHSRGGSDSEDMRRPFASIAREKKKQKKRKKNEDSDSVKSSSSSVEINDKISSSFKSVTESSVLNNTSTMYPSNSNSPLSLADYICETKMPEQNAGQESLSYKDVITKCSAGLKNKEIDSQSWIVENGYVGGIRFDKHSEMIIEEISNTSFSSAKENQNQRHKSIQELPKIKSLRFNIVKHKNKITNTFPPCFVVVKKLQMRKFMKDCNRAGSILPLSARLKHLSDLCDQGRVKCKKKKQEAGGELIYRNIFEETVLPETTENDVDSSRRRNLRKRDKHISYVEPSEDDILDEFSRKRRSKHKDTAVRSEDESTAENKKRKKHTSLSESKTDYSNTATSKAVTSKGVTVLIVSPPQGSSDKNKVLEDTGNGGESSKKNKEVTREIIVYPPVSSGSKNYYYARAGATTPKTANSTVHTKQKPTGTMQISPPSTNITVLPTTTISGAFMHHPNPVSIFPSLSLGVPGSFPTRTVMARLPLSSQISTAGGMKKHPQYCVVKMDGKDVLLQIVSSDGIGTAVPVVMPKGKALFTPSIPFVAPSIPLVAGSHFFGQPSMSLPSSTQSMSVPLTSVVTVSQGSVASAASLQPMMGIQVLNRPITTSSHNMSVSAFPVMQPAQLTSITNTTSVRPVNLSSVHQIPQSSTAFNSGVSVTSLASTTRPFSALPAAAAPMAAPNTTTVVRTVRVPGPSVRAVAPNQSTSLHSFRIFVPGCSATGMPSRFATLGTIANTNPLTHLAASSLLLPQRKLSADLEMTPEQRAAKRRKLEKKYPLPPGVVIKTEPLDAVPKPSPVITTVSGPRSLLSQNVHLLSSARPGTNFQSIRIISPSLANSLAARNLRGNSNIIYRAASIGGGQTILLPTSLGQICTRTTTTVTSVSVTSSSSLATSSSEPTLASASKASDNTNTNAANASDSPVSFSSFRPICENNVSSPVLQSAECASVSSRAAGLPDTDTTSSSSVVVTSGVPLVATNGINTASVSPLTSGAKSLHTSGTSAVAESRSLGSSPLLASAKGPCEVGSLENVRNALEELKKFIQVQESCGLKGDRLEKLKELLQKKEEQYKDMLQLADGGISLLSAPKTNGNIGAGGDNNVALNDQGGSETDPFVID